MGELLYERLIEEVPGAACRTYAPVGGHRDLLAYLVRRLLENGANLSFVSVAADPRVPVETLLQRPADIILTPEAARHPRLPLPRALSAPARLTPRGGESGPGAPLRALRAGGGGPSPKGGGVERTEGARGGGEAPYPERARPPDPT